MQIILLTQGYVLPHEYTQNHCRFIVCVMLLKSRAISDSISVLQQAQVDVKCLFPPA